MGFFVAADLFIDCEYRIPDEFRKLGLSCPQTGSEKLTAKPCSVKHVRLTKFTSDQSGRFPFSLPPLGCFFSFMHLILRLEYDDPLKVRSQERRF